MAASKVDPVEELHETCAFGKDILRSPNTQVNEEGMTLSVHTELKRKLPVFEDPDIVKRQKLLKESSVLNDLKSLLKGRELSVSFNEIMSQVGKCVDTVRLQGNPYRLSVVESDIWIPSNANTGDYEVFNISTKTLTPRRCDTLQGVMSFCHTYTGHVMAACGNGLFTLNRQGELQCKLSDGLFTDVCTNGEKILAVQYETCEVQVYTLTSNRWSKETEFLLKGRNNVLKTLHVVGDSVYVSYGDANTIYKYSLHGEFLEEYGGHEGKALGQFSVPFVSGTDSEQALIVCDCYNNRIQVRSKQGAWMQYTLKEVTSIADVVIVGEFLFVLEEDKKLSVYNIISQL